MKVNDYHKDSQYSLEASTENFWDAVYRKAFVDMKFSKLCTEKSWQLMGVDRFVYLKSGRIFAIDEKARREVYNDIALEYESNNNTGSPGWIEKQLAIDYLAYAFMPIKRVYLLDWPMLRRAWIAFGETWKKKYRIIEAYNKGGYITSSVAVPISVIRKKVHTATIIQLD